MDMIEHTQLANWLNRCRAVIRRIDDAQDSLQLDLPTTASEDLDNAKQEAQKLEREIDALVQLLQKLSDLDELPF